MAYLANKHFDLLPVINLGLRKLEESELYYQSNLRNGAIINIQVNLFLSTPGGTLRQIRSSWQANFLGPVQSSKDCTAEVEATSIK